MNSRQRISVECLWEIDQVSQYLQIPIPTLYAWRSQKKGPECRRIGKHLRYDPAKVIEWFNDQPAEVAA